MTAARARAAYRALLRAVDTHVTAIGGNTLWRDAVRDGFRAAPPAAGEAAEAALDRAEQLTFYVNSVNEHKVRALFQSLTSRRLFVAASAVKAPHRDTSSAPLTSRAAHRTCCSRTASAWTRRQRRVTG